MHRLIKGKMYSLDSALKIESQNRYILICDGEIENSISFGRCRNLNVPKETYIVSFCGGNYSLEKAEFDCNGKCDYLECLRKKEIPFEITKALPESFDKMYSRFECAIGKTHWSPNVNAFFGVNGYAVTDVRYVGADKYTSFEINIKPELFYLGNNNVIEIWGI